MKRLLLSVLGGFIIPFVYAVIAEPLSIYVQSERVKRLLWIPIGWPQVLYFTLSPPLSGPLHLGDGSALTFQIACDVALYGALTYLLLLLRSHRKPKTYGEPPPPPKSWAN